MLGRLRAAEGISCGSSSGNSTKMRTRLGRRPGGPWQRQALSHSRGEPFPPGGTVSLILLIAHLRLDEPERVSIAYLAALISETTGSHGRAVYEYMPELANRPPAGEAPVRLPVYETAAPRLTHQTRDLMDTSRLNPDVRTFRSVFGLLTGTSVNRTWINLAFPH